MSFYTYPPLKMEQTERSETSAYKIQMLGNYPEENIQHTKHGESLKSKTVQICYVFILLCYKENQKLKHSFLL
jgi:hypothetical protein